MRRNSARRVRGMGPTTTQDMVVKMEPEEKEYHETTTGYLVVPDQEAHLDDPAIDPAAEQDDVYLRLVKYEAWIEDERRKLVADLAALAADRADFAVLRQDVLEPPKLNVLQKLATPVTLLGGALTLAARSAYPKHPVLGLVPLVLGAGLSYIRSGK